MVTPAVTSELLRLDIAYVPAGNAVRLVNRTLAVVEGATQALTNATLWLETPDEANFRFTLAVAPLYGRLILGELSGGDDGQATQGFNFPNTLDSQWPCTLSSDGHAR